MNLDKIQIRAEAHNLQLREDELAFLVGFIECQVRLGISEIEKEISGLDDSSLLAN